jgi:hypothetical protein
MWLRPLLPTTATMHWCAGHIVGMRRNVPVSQQRSVICPEGGDAAVGRTRQVVVDGFTRSPVDPLPRQNNMACEMRGKPSGGERLVGRRGRERWRVRRGQCTCIRQWACATDCAEHRVQDTPGPSSRRAENRCLVRPQSAFRKPRKRKRRPTACSPAPHRAKVPPTAERPLVCQRKLRCAATCCDPVQTCCDPVQRVAICYNTARPTCCPSHQAASRQRSLQP